MVFSQRPNIVFFLILTYINKNKLVMIFKFQLAAYEVNNL